MVLHQYTDMVVISSMKTKRNQGNETRRDLFQRGWPKEPPQGDDVDAET